MEQVVEFVTAFGGGVFRIVAGIFGLVAYVYLSDRMTAIVRGRRKDGTLRCDGIFGIFFILFMTFIAGYVIAVYVNVPEWRESNIIFVVYLMIALVSPIILYMANAMFWIVDFSAEKIIEYKSFGRRKSVNWSDVLSWSFDDRASSVVLKLRGEDVFYVSLSAVEGRDDSLAALEARGVARDGPPLPIEPEE